VSLVIYPAYRLKRTSDLWPFIRDTRRKGEAAVLTVINRTYDDVSARLDPQRGQLKQAIATASPPINEPALRDKVAREIIRRLYRIASTSSLRWVGLDFDVSVTFREHHGRIYVIPYADRAAPVARCLDFLAKDRRLEDFHYQNASDKPAKISRQAWQARAKVWHELTSKSGPRDPWCDYLTLTICDWAKYLWLDSHVALDRARKRQVSRSRE
jgi:hypothetical protein